MADYKELLRKAVDALPENNGSARRAVYEKAREALVNQLRAIEPELPPREITQHRLTLEDCIRQVEQEATEELLKGLKGEDETEDTSPIGIKKSFGDGTRVARVTPSTSPSAAPPTAMATVVSDPEVHFTPKSEKAEPKAKATASEKKNVAEVKDKPAENEPTKRTPEAATKADAKEVGDKKEEVKAEISSAPDAKSSDKQNDDAKSQRAKTKIEETKAKAEEPETNIDIAPSATERKEADEKPSEGKNAADNNAAEDDVGEAKAYPKGGKVEEAEQKADIAKNADASKAVDKETTKKNKSKGASENKTDPAAKAIAEAKSATAKTDANTDSEKTDSDNAEKDVPDVEPALSSVREVSVDENATVGDISVSGEESQAAIDRAIKALDLEASGKPTKIQESDQDEAKTVPPVTKPSLLSDVKTQDFASDELPADEIIEEETGGNGLTVFLLLVIVLLLGAGGGVYWASKEGYIELEPLVAQLGLSDYISIAQTPEPTPETPTEEPEVPADVNVRDVTPGTDAEADVVEPEPVVPTPEVIPDIQVDEQTIEPSTPVVEEPVAENTETASVVEEQPVGENVTPENVTPENPEEPVVEKTPAPSTDERLPSESDSAEDGHPTLNVEDTNGLAAQVGSRSMLIEEQITGSGGAVPFTGETHWSRGVDELGVPVIKASISIPARNLAVDILIRKNSDLTLPASHLIEVNFAVTDSFLGGGVASLPGVLLKNEELAQGDPLIGASARIFDNSFLFALSAAESDLPRNLDLLSTRAWIDLPVVYSTGRKAIVTLEKGTSGAAIFEAVLAAWVAE